MKKMLLGAMMVAAGLCFGAANDLLFTFSTPGPDSYEDGTPVLNGERYALIWTRAGTEFAGLTEDCKPVDGNARVVTVGSLAKDGCCPETVFEIEAEYAATFEDGSFGLYLLDTRVDAGTLAPMVNGLPSRVNWVGMAVPVAVADAAAPAPGTFAGATGVSLALNGLKSAALRSVADSDVVAIGDTGYATLEAAFAAAQDGDTIKVLKDFKIEAAVPTSDKTLISVTKNCTLDLNNLTVEMPLSANKKSFKVFQMDDAKTLTIKNGSFIGPPQKSATDVMNFNPILVWCAHAEGKVILNDVHATFGRSSSGQNYAGIVCATGAIEIKDCIIDCLAPTADFARHPNPLVCVYNAGNAQITIEDSVIDFSNGRVDTGSRTNESKSVPVWVATSANTFNRYRLVLKGDCKLIPAADANHYYYHVPAIETVIGGAIANNVLDVGNTLVTVEAGRYNFNPQPNNFKGWIAEGCTVSGPVDNIWTVAGSAPVATDVAMDQNGNMYTSLATAFANVTDGGTITLLDDCEVTSPILVSENVSLDLDGHTISYTLLGVHGDGTCFNVTGTGDFTIYSSTGTGKFVGKKHGMVTFGSTGNLSVSDVEMSVGTGWTSTFTPGDPYDPAFRIKSGTAVIADTSVTESFLAPVCIDGAATVTLGAGNNFKVNGMTGNASTVNPVLSAVVYCKDGTVSITGGRYESDCYGVYLTGGSIGTPFTMSNGELHAGYVVLQNDLTDAGKMKVTGGKLKVKDTNKYLLKCGTATPKIVLEGGLYNVNPADNSFIGADVASGKKTSSFVGRGYKVETVIMEEVTWYKVVEGASDPLPDPSDVTTPEKVAEVMADAADSLKANVTTVQEYSDFRAWVESCGLEHETAKAGKDSFFSFATAQNGIVDTDTLVTPETVKTVGMEPTADGVKLTVKIDDLPVGEAAQQKYLEKVFGAKGSDSLTGFSKENVQYVSESMARTADGSVTFTVKPAEKFGSPSQFFFVGAVSPDGE